MELSQLIADLSSPDAAKRSDAAEQLAHLGPDAREATAALVRATSDEEEEVREWAAAALEDLGPPMLSSLPALAALLSEPNADIGYWAATLLGRLGAEALSAVPALARVVSGDADLTLRQRAAWALGQIGPAAKPALDDLRKAAAGNDPRLARLAQEAIQRIG